MSEPMTCPCCGSLVRVYTGDEGTSSYELLVPADALDKAREALWEMRRGLELISHRGDAARKAYYEPHDQPPLFRGLPTMFSQVQEIARESLRRADEALAALAGEPKP